METTQLPVFELKIGDLDSTSGVYAASLVTDPAIQETFIALAENVKHTFNTDTHKQILTGPLIIPNQLIYRRKPTGEEYYVYFSAETIEKIQHKFFKSGFQSNTTHQHLLPLSGNTIVESWIVTDPDVDKSKALGFNLQAGTWMISVKIDDKNYWDSEVMTGNIKGFSLEGLFQEIPVGIQEGEPEATIQLNQIDEMENLELAKKNKKMKKEKSRMRAILDLLGIKLSNETLAEAEVKLASFYLPDGTELIVDDETLSLPIFDVDGMEIGILRVEITPEAITSPDDTMEPVESPIMVTAEKVEDKNEEMLETLTASMVEMKSTLMSEIQKLNSEISVLKSGTVKQVEFKKEADYIGTVKTNEKSLKGILTKTGFYK